MATFLAVLYLAVLLELSIRAGKRLAADRSIFVQWSQGLAATTVGFSLLALLLGRLGALSPLWIRCLMAPSLLLLGRPVAVKALAETFAGLSPAVRAVLGAGWVLVIVGSLAPNTQWDTNVYHYTLPRLYLQQGAVYWTGTGIYDSLAGLMHLLYAWSMGCAGELGANVTGPAMLWMLFCSLAALQPQGAPWLGALVLSSPLLVTQAQGGLTDLPGAAYIAAMLCAPRPVLGGCWAVAAVVTRMNAAAAVGLWALFAPGTSRRVRVIGVVLGLAAGVLALTLLPWSVRNLQSAHAGGAYPLLTSAPTGLHGVRSWMHSLSPLLLPGLLLCGPHPLRIFCVAATVAAGILHLAEARYVLPWVIGWFVLAAHGWSVQVASMRKLFVASSIVAMLLAMAPLAPRVATAVGLQGRNSFLTARVTPYRGYVWLATTSYQRVLLTDPRAYLCPKPFALIDQTVGPRARSDAQVAAGLQGLGCDLILWNFNQASVAEAALAEAAALGDLEGSSATGLIAQLGAPWLQEARSRWPHLTTRLPAPGPIHHFNARLRVLYRHTRHLRPVFNEGGVIAVECPRTLRP